MPNCLIVDDEERARNAIAKMVSIYCPQLKIAGTAANIEEAEEKVEKLNPDLVFLDIDIGTTTAFDLLEKTGVDRFQIIFITAFSEYAIRAFELSAIDYLLKPVDPERLTQAVEKALKQKDQGSLQTQFSNLFQNLSEPRKLVISTQDGMYAFELEEIVRCEADGNYTRFFFKKTNSLVVATTLMDYERKLGVHGFFRVHKKHLINTQYFRKIEKSPADLVELTTGDKIPLAWRRKEDLTEFIKGRSI